MHKWMAIIKEDRSVEIEVLGITKNGFVRPNGNHIDTKTPEHRILSTKQKADNFLVKGLEEEQLKLRMDIASIDVRIRRIKGGWRNNPPETEGKANGES